LRPPIWTCDGSHLSRGISSTFLVSTDCTGLSLGATTVCSASSHLLHLSSVIAHALFSPHCESPPKYAHASAPNPLANIRSFQPALPGRGFSDRDFFALCNFTPGPINNDQRRLNRRRRWQVRLPGRCNRASPGSRWTITKSFQLSGTTSDSPKGCITGLAMMSRPGF